MGPVYDENVFVLSFIDDIKGVGRGFGYVPPVSVKK